MALGIAPFIMQSTESLALISLNNQLLKYSGDLAVGAMAIISSIMQIILMPLIFIFPMFFEYKFKGVLIAEPVSNILATLVTIICFYIYSKKMFQRNKDDDKIIFTKEL